MRSSAFIWFLFYCFFVLGILADGKTGKDKFNPIYTKDDINYIITGSCLYTYSRFVNEFKRVSRNSLLWPKLNKNESAAKIKHRFQEKYAMFSSFMAIKKILQIQSRYSVNSDYSDTILFLRLNIALMENKLEANLGEMSKDDKAKLLEVERRIVENNFILNKYYINKTTSPNHEKSLFKIFLRFFIYPAYLDIYNYGSVILSRYVALSWVIMQS